MTPTQAEAPQPEVAPQGRDGGSAHSEAVREAAQPGTLTPRRRRELALIALIVLQGFCAAYFVLDVIRDAIEAGRFEFHLGIELFANLGLVAGVVVEVVVLRNLLAREARTAEALSVAQGAMAELMRSRFADWGLTPSEADVAGFTVKGFSIAEVAGLRGSSEATVKTHLNAVYRKAGVAGRAQLVSVFVEELFAGPLDGGP